MYPTVTETVQIVDEDNREIAAVPRHIMREQNLIHRASYVLVFNREGQLFVQKRTMNKDVYPGFFDIAAGGVVLAGESYEEAAKRELAEELGISDVRLNFLFDQYYEDKDNRVWGRIFFCRHQGPFVLQQEEVAWGRFMDLTEILALGDREPVTPDGLEVLKRLQETPTLLAQIKES
ncbi:NUDIX hydrolase YfcD [Desulfolithobacter sp.]